MPRRLRWRRRVRRERQQGTKEEQPEAIAEAWCLLSLALRAATHRRPMPQCSRTAEPVAAQLAPRTALTYTAPCNPAKPEREPRWLPSRTCGIGTPPTTRRSIPASPRTALTNMEGKHDPAGLPGVRQPVLDPHGRVPEERGRAAGHPAPCDLRRARRRRDAHHPRRPISRAALAGASIPGVGKVERITGTEAAHFYKKIFGRTGIIYIQDYWKRARRDGADRRPHRRVERLPLLHQVADGVVLLARLLLQLRAGQGDLVLGREVAQRGRSVAGRARSGRLEETRCDTSLPWRAPSSWPSSPRCSSACRSPTRWSTSYTFDSPDTVADLHAAVFMLSNLAALLIGWIVGWIVGGRFATRAPVAMSRPVT